MKPVQRECEWNPDSLSHDESLRCPMLRLPRLHLALHSTIVLNGIGLNRLTFPGKSASRLIL